MPTSARDAEGRRAVVAEATRLRETVAELQHRIAALELRTGRRYGKGPRTCYQGKPPGFLLRLVASLVVKNLKMFQKIFLGPLFCVPPVTLPGL